MSDMISTDPPQASEAGAAAEATCRVTLLEAWQRTVTKLAGRLSDHTHRTYVASARVLPPREGDRDVLRLAYPSLFLANWVGDHYRETFEAELLEASNRRILVAFEERPPDPEPEPEPEAGPTLQAVAPPEAGADDPAASTPRPESGSPTLTAVPGETQVAAGLSPRHTFETFVVGTSNQFAHAACRAVAGAPGRTYNPLFLYGGSGLGKTHLMQATGLSALAESPLLRIVYTTGEQFTNELITALQFRRMPEFRRRYREQCDVLLIDDVNSWRGRSRPRRSSSTRSTRCTSTGARSSSPATPPRRRSTRWKSGCAAASSGASSRTSSRRSWRRAWRF